MKPNKRKWTADEREFDRLMTLMESRVQMDRIKGRIAYDGFASRFTYAEMEKMAKTIGARKTK